MIHLLHRKRALRAVLLLLLMTAGVTKVFAQNFWVNNIQYYVTNGTNVEVGGALVNGNILTIPSTITYENTMYTVVGIRSYAFENRENYTRYELPNTMTNIGTGAFKNSIIESISFSDNLTDIGACAFEGCESLTMLNLTNCTNMTTIGTNAFYGMPNVWLIMLPESITTIGIGAFSGCTNLKNLYLPGSLTTIGDSAFSNCSSLQSLTLPQSVTALGLYLFNGCTALKDLYVQRTTPPSASYQTFDGWFQDYAEHVYIPYGSGSNYQGATGWSNLYANNLITETNTLVYDYVWNDDHDAVATVTGHIGNVVGALDIPDYSKHHSTFHKVTAVANEAFAHCTDITSVTFGEFMEDLGHDAFEACTGITSVDLSACRNMTEIGETAFQGCIGLTSVTLPPTLLSVGNYAFYNCGLTSITLPSHVMSIGSGAFCSCYSLATITSMNPVPPTVGNQVFDGSNNITKIKVPYGAKTNYLNAPVWGSFDESIYEEMSPAFVFYYDDDNQIAIVMGYNGAIPSVLEIPATVTHNDAEYTVRGINGSAFKNQTGVSRFILPNTITAIGPDAFRGCRYADINIPESLTSLGEGAFVDCDHLTSVTLPEGLTSIPALAFYSCSFITELRLPSTLTTIGIRAFANCSNLENIVTYATTPPTCEVGNGNDSFLNVSCVVHVPVGCYEAYHTAAGWSNMYIEQGGLIYAMNGDNTEAIITGVHDYTFGDLVIPEMMNNRPVTTIAENAFRNKSGITSISLPASVTTIESQAFANCSDLTAINVDANNESYMSVDGVLFSKDGKTLVAYPAGKTDADYSIPAGVEDITSYAFEDTQLTSINLPASFPYNASFYNAFYGANNLESLTVDANHTHIKAVNGVLFSVDETCLIFCPRGKAGHYTVPSTVTHIYAQAFADCSKITGVTLNDGLQSIEMYAFARCTGLTSISIPEGITNIYMCTFMNCSGLKTVSLPTTLNYIDQFAFANTGLISLTLPENIMDIGNNAFGGCVNLGEVTLNSLYLFVPDGQNIFNGINTYEIPLYVNAAQLGNFAGNAPWMYFNVQPWPESNGYLLYTWSDVGNTAHVAGVSDNQAISGDLVIPGTLMRNNKTYTVISIDNAAFKGCTNLTSVVIPHTVETIGDSAFIDCTRLTALTIGRNVKTIGSNAFHDCYQLSSIEYYATNCQTVADNAWYVDGTSIEQIAAKTLDIKNCVQTIPSCCFYSLYGLRDATVTIPNSVTAIGDYAFRYSDLKGIAIGGNVTSIGIYAFDGTGLTSVVLPSNVTSVGERTFYNCPSLASATVWGVADIPLGMFENCTALTSFDVKSPVRTIGKKAFAGCTSLTTLTTAGYASNLTVIGEEAFSGCTALTAVDIPNSVTDIKQQAFGGCNALQSLVIGTGVKSIGFAAFYYCSNLTSIDYRATRCKSVYTSVWSGVGDNPKTLTIGANVEVIPPRAFENLRGFTTVTLPNALTLIRYNAFKGCSLTEITIPNNVTEIEYDAFMSCNLQTIVLGSNLNIIGSYAFAGNAHIAEITSYNVTPPAVTESSFSNYDATLKVLAPAINAYNAHSVWSLFTNTESLDGYYFTGATNSNWGTASNWSNGTVPTTELYGEVTAVIMADATVNITDAFVKSFTIMDGTTVTIASGKSLKIGDGGNGSFTSSGASALVVEDGGSIVNNLNQNIAATVEKNITGYGNSSGNWNFISSPIVGANTYEENYNLYYYTSPNNVENLFANPANNYDLYAFDQSAAEAEWVNYKQHSEDFKLVDGNGYLYANHDNVTLSFAGDVRPSNSDYYMTPVFKQDVQVVYINPDNPDEGYNEQTVDYPFTGWNLVGNPFTCKAYIKDDYSVLSSGFYKMNPDGTGITSVEGFSEEIPAGTGVFVKVSDMYDPMSGNQYAFTTETPMRGFTNGSLQVVLKQALMRGDAVQVDNAIVSFNEGNPLEKLVLFRDDAHVAIPQNGKKYAIVCTEPCGEMPLNLDAVMGGRFTLEVAPKDVEMSYLHLIDNLTGTDVDLLKESSYSFESNISDYASRFKLVFVAGSAAAEMEDFAFFSNGNLVIANNGEAMLQVVDINGRVLRSKRINGSANVSLNESAGVYVLRLVNGENVKIQKIIIK